MLLFFFIIRKDFWFKNYYLVKNICFYILNNIIVFILIFKFEMKEGEGVEGNK